MKLNTIMALIISLVVACGMAIILTVNYVITRNQMFDSEFERARSFILAAEGVREWGARQLKEGVFATEEIKTDVQKFLYTVPVIGAIRVMESKSEEAGLKFKVPKFQPRNPKNQPDAKETEILEMLRKKDTGTGNTPEYMFYDKEMGMLRYFKAIRLTKECEMCHGDPADSGELWGTNDGTDPTGVKMENWRAGEIHGAFEVFLPTDTAYAMLRKGLYTYIGIFIPITIALILIIYALNKKMIFRRLEDMERIFSTIASGDYTVRVRIKRNDEVGKLGIAVNKMVDGTSQALSNVVDSISSLASTAAQLAKNSETIAKNAQNQAEQAASTATAVEEISGTVAEVAENAGCVSESTNTAKVNVTRGHALVMETRDMMEKIACTVEESASTVRKLGESSEQIGAIIQVIDDIADQTNLLALNAAIEAARAGEHGRGFAVVADEVRKLAEKTVKATKEIADMIQNIQADTGGAVLGMAEGVQQVEDGKVKAVEAGDSLGVIKSNMDAVAGGVEQIARATDEQANAMDLMSRSIENISAISGENSHAAHESAEAVEQLSRLASDLQNIISRFRL